MEAILFQPIKNKIYRMKKSEGQIVVEFGYIGNRLYTKFFPETSWNELYQEKIANGYVDQTGLLSEGEVIKKDKISDISDINTVLKNLSAISRQLINENYRILGFQVTDEAITKAKELIKRLENASNLYDFNNILFELFSLIPRKMKNVIQNTAKAEDDFFSIIERENDLLNNLTINKENKSIQQIPFICSECTSNEAERIRDMLDPASRRKFSRVWKIDNPENDERFNRYVKTNGITKTRELFHGSRSENWWSILLTRLMLSPSNVVKSGAMFGRGIYFADKADKSMGYTSLYGSRHAGGQSNKAYLAIYEVATGNEFDVDTWDSSMVMLDNSRFKREHRSFDSLHAHAGQNLINDEYIIYNEDACRIKYFLEFTI